MPAVSVLIDSLIGYYALEPVVQELSTRDCELHIFAPRRIHESLASLLKSAGLARYPLVDIGEGAFIAKRLHRLLRQLLTRPSFSFQYRLLARPEHGGGIRYWLASQLARISPGLPHDRVNRALSAIVGWFATSCFPSDVVLTVSRSSLSHLLCARGLRVVTVLESWDHPVKWPVGHVSDAVFAWNDDLAQDWRQYQGDSRVIASYPLKLRYWIARDLPIRPLDAAGRRAVYAAGTSSMSYINRLHDHELAVIEAVCEATGRAGWQLMIKPKPNGRIGDFDRFMARYPHVSVGTYRNASSPTNYYLDDDYNRIRERELGEADLVINSVTTFALDAALGGAPCLQIDLRGCPEYGGLAEGQTNHHIARYLLGDPALCLTVAPGRLTEQLSSFLEAPDSRAEAFSRRMREWLKPSLSCPATAAAIADRVLAAQARVRGRDAEA